MSNNEEVTEVAVTIRNFKKYMCRKEIINPWWFKLNNSIYDDPEINELNDQEFRAWIYILCMASKKKCSKVIIFKSHFEMHNRSSFRVVIDLLKKLLKYQIVTYDLCRSCAESVLNPPTICAESAHDLGYRLEEKREEENYCSSGDEREILIKSSKTNTSPRDKFDFEAAYQTYPKKLGKAKGLTRLRKTILTQKDYDDLLLAIRSYSKKCESENRDKKYIKQFDTFISSWREYLEDVDPDTIYIGPPLGKSMTQEELAEIFNEL